MYGKKKHQCLAWRKKGYIVWHRQLEATRVLVPLRVGLFETLKIITKIGLTKILLFSITFPLVEKLFRWPCNHFYGRNVNF